MRSLSRRWPAVSQRQVGYERQLLALLGWVARMGDLPDFPQEVAWALEESAPLVLGPLETQSEIVLATCHLLAGQSLCPTQFCRFEIQANGIRLTLKQ